MAGYVLNDVNLRFAILKRDQFTCQYCGVQTRNCIVEHVIPVSRGGPAEAFNLVAACRPCNSSKYTRVWVPKNLGAIAHPEWHAAVIDLAAKDAAAYRGPAKDLKQMVATVPAHLHKRIKLAAIEQGTSINALLTEFLEREFPPER